MDLGPQSSRVPFHSLVSIDDVKNHKTTHNLADNTVAPDDKWRGSCMDEMDH